MFAIIMSGAIVLVGAWLTVTQNDAMMGVWGAMLLVLGMTFLGFNVYAHRKGFRLRRRR